MYVMEHDGQFIVGSMMHVRDLVDDYEATITRDWIDDDEREAIDKAIMIMSALSLQEWRNMS